LVLSKAKNLSLTIDLWTDRKGLSYLGITSHFINENFEFINIVIALQLMKEKKTAIEIFNNLQSILTEYEIFK